MDFDEAFASLHKRLTEAEGYLRLGEIRERRADLERTVAEPDLWDDADKARQLNQELAEITEDIDLWESLSARVDDAETLLELGQEEADASIDAEVEQAVDEIAAALDQLELRSLFTGEHDERDAVCFIQAGEGGTDSQDWAEMLFRMYSRWSDNRGFATEVTYVSEGNEAGFSSVEFIIKGRLAYGHLRSEHGVHRLVRISPFNKEGKRQTAFASMQVVPLFEDVASEIDIDETELRIDTFRSSGAGGQHVNVTDSAVRITHLPTGLVVSCQNERSQHQNKDRAMQMLASKLLDLERQKREDELAEISGEAKRVGFGSQIRSYVTQPYRMVKDLRSEHEVGDVDPVLNGNIDGFIEAYLRWKREQNEG